MDNITLNVSDIIVSGQLCYRIIYVSEKMCVLCKMECTYLDLIYVPTNDLMEQLFSGTARVENDEAKRVVDYENLPEPLREKFLSKRNFIRDVKAAYGPFYLDLLGKKNKSILKKIISAYNLSHVTAWRCIRIYLQSGLDENSLLPKPTGTSTKAPYGYTQKPGRKCTDVPAGIRIDDEVLRNFKEAVAFYKSGRTVTQKDAFDMMNLQHYSKTELDASGHLSRTLLPETQRPTFRQFRYYLDKVISKEEKDRIKTSAQEQRNNKRLLLSDNLKNIMGPGDCIEMDEVEVDVSLVSQINPDQTVGRPIVYAMIDVYTRAIVSVSVSFENNSVIGLTNCLLALADDKIELCANYGLSISNDIWPSNFIPRTVRTDRGSEYRSKEAKRIFNELNINLELVPGGSGSLKGSVEQWFHQMHSAQNALLEGKGLIEKRHDSKHHREALLTIEEFKRILYAFVVAHNQTYMKRYPLTHEMIAEKVAPTPCDLWKFGVAQYGALPPITNKHQFIYSLLRPIDARITRKGIIYKDLYYMDSADLALRDAMYRQGNKSATFEARIDPRDVGSLYTIGKDGALKSIPLNTERTGNNYQGVSLAEYEEIRKAKKTQDKIGEIGNEELRAKWLGTTAATIAAAEIDAPRYANAKNIRNSRSLEKKIEGQKSAVSHLLAAEQSKIEAAPMPEAPVLVGEGKKEFTIIDNIDDALDLFFGGDDG